MKTCELTSAGGVVFRKGAASEQIALVKTASEGRWQLPKGIIDPGETPEQAPLREVSEEAGLTCEILRPLEVIDYWYVDRYGSEPIKTHKFVHYFMMKYLFGDVANHDDEIFEARWVEAASASKMLSFATERAVVEKAVRELG